MRDLISEISRIREMMNLPNNLLTEAIGIPAGLKSYLDNLVSTSYTTFNIGGIKILKKEIQDIIVKLSKSDFKIDNLTSREQSIIGHIIGSTTESSENFYKSFIEQEMNRAGFKTEVEFIQDLQRKMQLPRYVGYTFDNVIEDIYRHSTYKDLILPAIKPTLERQYDTLRTSPSNFRSVLSVGPAKKLTKQQIDKIKKVIDKKSSSTFAKDFITYYRKSIDEIIEEIRNYNNGYLLEELQKKATIIDQNTLKAELKGLQEAYAAKITSLMNQLEIRKNGAAADALDTIGLDPDITTIIRTDSNEFFAMFREIWAKEGESLTEMIKGTNISFLKEFSDSWKQLTTKGQFWKGIGSILDPRTSIGQFMFTSQFASINKQYLALIKTSALENKSNKFKFSQLYLAQSFIGYYIGFLVYEVLFWMWEAVESLFFQLFDFIQRKLLNVWPDIPTPIEKPENLFLDEKFLNNLWVKFKDMFSILSGFETSGLTGVVVMVFEIIRTLIPGGFGTIRDGIVWDGINATFFRLYKGKQSPDIFINEVGLLFSTMIGVSLETVGVAEVTAYRDNLESFKKFLVDQNLSDKYDIENSIEERDTEGKWYVAKGKNNEANRYYKFNETNFIPE